MTLWQELITQMLWHLIIIGSVILSISILFEILYQHTFTSSKLQRFYNVITNLFSVIASLIFIAAFISATIESMRNFMLITFGLFVLSFIVAIKVYKGES